MARNRQRDIEEMWRRRGSPTLPTKPEFKTFTTMVAAGLHFGIAAWGIEAEPGWGVRRNSTGTTSSDTLRFLDEIAVDIAPGSGSVEWGSRPDDQKFHWLVFEPGSDDFGVAVEPARRVDLPAVVDPPPPPHPAGGPTNLFGHFSRDLKPFFSGAVPAHEIFDEIIRRVRGAAKLPVVDSDWPSYRTIAWWRYFNETHNRNATAHDAAQTFAADGGGKWTTLEEKLRDFWGVGEPDPEPLPSERNILDFVRGDLVGHFLAGPLYFAPSYSIRNETQFRVACQWFKDNGYNCAVWMTEQSHWAEHGTGRDPAWTDPGPSGAPLIYISPDGFRIFGWPLDEQLRRIRIMRADYGLHVVASLWDQPRIEHDFDSAIRNTPRIVENLDADVIAWLNTWEQNEVLDRAQERILNNAVGAAAIKSSGPHWGRGIPDADYWDGDRSHVFWHQYDRGGDLSAQARESVRLCRESDRVSIGYEHSGMLPSTHRPVHTLEECKQRGRDVVARGEHLSLTG